MLVAILFNNLLIEEAKRDCSVDWIYVLSHRDVFRGMLSLHAKKQEINATLLCDELRDASIDALYFAKLVHGVPGASRLGGYIDRIREAARRRWAINFAALLDERARAGDVASDHLFADAINKLDAARGLGRDKRNPATLEQLADDQLLRYELFLKGISDALPTGFPEIDKHLLGGGLVPSGLYILAAPTSMGKSTLGLDIAANAGAEGRRVYILSREMSRESLFDRLVSFESGVERWKIRPGIWESDYRRTVGAVNKLSAYPIILDDNSSTVSEVRGYFREHENRGERIDMLVVDYLQLLEAEGRRKETRNQEVGSLSRSLKGLAMEFRVPVLAISQLKRIGGREPELDDLRDSGEIEQDADAVMFLFGERPEEGAKFYDRTLKCSKQREGPLFREQLPFNGELVSYRRVQRIERENLYEHDN